MAACNSLGTTQDRIWVRMGRHDDEQRERIARCNEGIHSGHFMVSNPHTNEDSEPGTEPASRDDADPIVDVTLQDPETIRSLPRQQKQGFVKAKTIDASLAKLFECMSLAYSGKLTSPKWKTFKGMKLGWKDKIRLNNVIWRCWHIQYVKDMPPVICQFSIPSADETQTKPKAVILEGKYWKRRLDSVCEEYKKWRLFFREQFSRAPPLEADQGDVESHAELLERVGRTNWSWPQNCAAWNEKRQTKAFASAVTATQAANLFMDDDLMDFTDTLFTSLNQPYPFPNSREINAWANNADIIQPGLVQLQPNLDDLMDFEPLQEMLSKMEWVNSPMSDDMMLHQMLSHGCGGSMGQRGSDPSLDVSCVMAATMEEEGATCSSLGVAPFADDSALGIYDDCGADSASFARRAAAAYDAAYALPTKPGSPVAMGTTMMPPPAPRLDDDDDAPLFRQQGSPAFTVDTSFARRRYSGPSGYPACSPSDALDKSVPSPLDQPVSMDQQPSLDQPVSMDQQASIPQQGSISSIPQHGSILQQASISAIPQQAGIGAIPQQAGIGAIPQQGSIASIPQTGSIASIPQQAGIGAIPQQGSIASIPQTGSIASIPQQAGIGAIPQQGSIASIPQTGSIASIPQQAGIGAIPQQGSIASIPQTGSIASIPQKGSISAIPQQGSMIQQARMEQQASVAQIQPQQTEVFTAAAAIAAATTGARDSGATTTTLVVTSAAGSGQPQVTLIRSGPATTDTGGAFAVPTPKNKQTSFSRTRHMQKISPAPPTKPAAPSVISPPQVAPAAAAASPASELLSLLSSDKFSGSRSGVGGQAIAPAPGLHGAPMVHFDLRPAQSEPSTFRSPLLLNACGSQTDGLSILPSIDQKGAAMLDSGAVKKESLELNLSPAMSPAWSDTSATVSPMPGQKLFSKPMMMVMDDDKKTYREHRRVCHINAEQKRRCNIKSGFDTLHQIIPALRSSNVAKASKANMLQKAVDYTRQLKAERQQMQEEAEQLRQQKDVLEGDINNLHQELPATGVPVTRQRANKVRDMFTEYVRSRTLNNWKFWIFSIIIKPLFENYNATVSTSSLEELYRTVMLWLNQHCSLTVLRPSVLSSLRYVSRTTTILTDPSQLPQHARNDVQGLSDLSS